MLDTESPHSRGAKNENEKKKIGDSGTEHDKDFIASAKVDGMFHVTAKGHTKKHAEQHAAYEALVEFKKQGYEFPIRKKQRNCIYVFKEYRGSGF